MRPTLLDFRSPKERTPDFYNPDVTYDGRKISYSPERAGTIPHSARFTQYRDAEIRTAIIVGPGSYTNDPDSISKSPGRAVFKYSRPHCSKQTGNNGYFMVGDHLVFDANLMSNRGKLLVTDTFCKVDETSAISPKIARGSSKPHRKIQWWPDKAGSLSPRRFDITPPLARHKRPKREFATKKSDQETIAKEFNKLIELRFKTDDSLLQRTS